MKTVFKIAILQEKSISKDYEGNTKKAMKAMGIAKKLGADIVLLPECFITGYELPIQKEEAFEDDSKYLKALANHAKDLSIGIVATAFTKGEIKAMNSAFVIDKEGKTLMKYNKVHTCDFDAESCLESGKEFQVCDFHGVKLGIMICYDREYPESARVLMLKGAEIILMPNDCHSMNHRLDVLKTRAYENMTGIVMANPPGKNAGCSCAYQPDPWDEDENDKEMEIFRGDEESTKIYYAEYNLDELRGYRKNEMMGNTFRKVEAYGPLLDGKVEEPFIR